MLRLGQTLIRQLTRVKPIDLSTAVNVPVLRRDRAVEEENHPHYVAKYFYPVKLGEVVHDTYQILVKLGYGGGSTVWLARDLRRFMPRYVALKIRTNNPVLQHIAQHEVIMERHIAAARSGHPGRNCIRLMRDSFEIKGPSGPHKCLVYEPMREPIQNLQARFVGGVYPLNVLQHTIKSLLLGLSYLHDECNVVHTDLKPNNILAGLEEGLCLDDVVIDERISPSPRKVLPFRCIYLSRNMFPHTKGSPGRPKIADFDCSLPVTRSFSHRAQPDRYRAPEVILGAPWSYPVDLWNLGAMLWDLLEGEALFNTQDFPNRHSYNGGKHLAMLINVLGPPPKELLARGALTNQYFSSKGKLKGRFNIPRHTLADTVTRIHGEEKEEFLRFVRRMLQWLPEKRATAQELLDDPYVTRVRI